MEILITLDRIEPPAGTVQQLADAPSDPHDGEAIPFTGWLGMLHAMSALIGVPGDERER